MRAVLHGPAVRSAKKLEPEDAPTMAVQFGKKPLTPQVKRNIGRAYGMTWEQLQAIRKLGLTVTEWRLLSEAKSA
jgi:hypothetical protein